MIYSTLEILRYEFPWHIANQIYHYMMMIHKREIIIELKEANNINNILNIKKGALAHWIVSFDSIFLRKYAHKWTQPNEYLESANTILDDNHKSHKGWRKRNVKYNFH